MQAAFWHSRWANNQIGFHQPEVNPFLQRHWPLLDLAAGARVLVPLSGKSLDMAWLAGQGFEVIGVELSERAAQDFFREQGVEPQVEAKGPFIRYSGEGVTILCGDFFALTVTDVAGCSAFYDRAAVIALPEEMRRGYARHLEQILPVGAKGLVITLDYDQSVMDGPPFAVSNAEVDSLFVAWQPVLLEEQDVLQESPKFLQAGAAFLAERVYRMHRESL